MDYTLEIIDWRGLSLDATHFYGKMVDGNHREVKCGHVGFLTKPLSPKDAIELNKKLRNTYSDEYYNLYKVSPGDIDHRFKTRNNVIEHAKEVFLKIAQSNDRLIDYEDKNIVYIIKG